MTPEPYTDLIGIPFRHAGRLPGRGIDCFGVLIEVYRRQGIAIPDVFVTVEKDWAKAEASTNATEWVREHLSGWHRREHRAIGCTVALSRGHGVVDHAGVMVSESHFIHALEKCGVVLSNIDRKPWCDYLVGYYDYRT